MIISGAATYEETEAATLVKIAKCIKKLHGSNAIKMRDLVLVSIVLS